MIAQPKPEREPASTPCVRLFDPSEISIESNASGRGGVSPEMTLGEFFETYHVPVVLAGEKQSSAGTITSCREGIAWWVRLTGDPPLASIDRFTLAKFAEGLRTATYRRGKAAKERTLAAYTIAKHFNQVQAVLYRAGPDVDPRRPAAELIEKVPRLARPRPRKCRPKPCFTVAEAKRMIGATDTMTAPAHPGVDAPSWWRALLLTLFYTGLRVGTVLELRFKDLAARGDEPWLEVPEDAVHKTHKWTDIYLRREAALSIEAIRTDRPRIFEWPHCHKRLSILHETLMERAGVKTLSFSAWRRTHAAEIGRAGAKLGMRIAQRAMDHADARTTAEHYVDLNPVSIRAMPSIVPKREDTRQKRLF